MLLGYARESAAGPPLQEQIDRLKAAGCKEVFNEPWNERRELAKALHALDFGDVLAVTSLDRLAWTVREVFEITEKLVEKGAGLRSLLEPWADPTTEEGRHILTVLEGMARFETVAFADRMKSTRAEAIKRGKKLGRRRSLTPDEMEEARALYAKGNMTMAAVADHFNVSEATISRLINPKRPAITA